MEADLSWLLNELWETWVNDPLADLPIFELFEILESEV